MVLVSQFHDFTATSDAKLIIYDYLRKASKTRHALVSEGDMCLIGLVGGFTDSVLVCENAI